MHLLNNFEALNATITQCRLCPRLVQFRESVPPRRAFVSQTYWRKPLAGYGDPDAWLLITGLAPAADGGNRTGRIFTGDGTSQFLMRGLYEAGFANQPSSTAKGDGLHLTGCYLTAAVKCVPPQNRPTRQEEINCHHYYQNELFLLKNLTHVLALGKLAFDAYLRHIKQLGRSVKGIKFTHGAIYPFENMPTLVASYHPTPRNTNTGTLTPSMFQEILSKVMQHANSQSHHRPPH